MVVSPGVVHLGKGGSGVPTFQGMMDEVRIWRLAQQFRPVGGIECRP
jgi:hypothetical protein